MYNRLTSFGGGYTLNVSATPDIINKVAVGSIAFQAAEQVLEQRVAEDATAPYHQVG